MSSISLQNLRHQRVKELEALLQTERVTSKYWKDKYEKAHSSYQDAKQSSRRGLDTGRRQEAGP